MRVLLIHRLIYCDYIIKERERETERGTHTRTERERDRESETERQTEKERKRERERERERERQRERKGALVRGKEEREVTRNEIKNDKSTASPTTFKTQCLPSKIL